MINQTTSSDLPGVIRKSLELSYEEQEGRLNTLIERYKQRNPPLLEMDMVLGQDPLGLIN